MQILTLSLNLPLHPGNLRAFRSAIVECVGVEQELFHNHDLSSPNEAYFHWDYPLIQYSVRRGQATITGLGAGAEAVLQQLLPKLPAKLTFLGETHPIPDYQLSRQEHDWTLLPQPRNYGLFGWIALNKNNYRQWKQTANETGRQAVLSRALTGHLRALGKAVGVEHLQDIHGQVLEVFNRKRAFFHNTHFIRFHAAIQSNLDLPQGIGLGRAAAFGFGEIQEEAAFYRQMDYRSQALLY